MTIVGEPFREKLKEIRDPTDLEWMKDMKRQIDQLQAVMKKNGLIRDFADMDLDLEEKQPLPPKIQISKHEEVLCH